jgi:hypothetical protein
MQLVRYSADHKSGSICEGDIIFWIGHFHVFRLEVAVHYKTAHEKVFAKKGIGSSQESTLNGRTYFYTLSSLVGG